jgi:hypothetical protein
LLLLLRLWACGQRGSVVQAQHHVHNRFAVSTADAFAQTANGVRLPSAWCGRLPLYKKV